MEKEQAKKVHDLVSEITKNKNLLFLTKTDKIYDINNRESIYSVHYEILRVFKEPIMDAMKTHIESLEKQLEQL